MHAYNAQLAHLSMGCSFGAISSRCHELESLCHMRPELSANVAILLQTFNNTFTSAHTKTLNMVFTQATSHPNRGISHHKLQTSSIGMLVFIVSSFASLQHQKTQLGYIVILTGSTSSVNILHYSSYKCRHVVQSELTAKTYAFLDGFDMEFLLRHDIKSMLQRRIAVTLVTSSESL